MTSVNVSPETVISQVARSIPPGCKENIVIVGSLAVGYQMLPHDKQYAVRTKDIDCVLSPRIEAAGKGKEIVRELLRAGWSHRTDGLFGQPGTEVTPADRLPAIRLYPPQPHDGWWLELLTEPDQGIRGGKAFYRVALDAGDYGIPSFTYTSLSIFDAEWCPHGIRIARPEMMALANMLEHQTIKSDVVKELYFKNREIKRSNKDLGRVLAIGWLSNEGSVEEWPDMWHRGLEKCFPGQWREFAQVSGNGLRALRSSPEDLEEAVNLCQNGILSGQNVTLENLASTADRILTFAVGPLERRSAEG